MGSQASRTVAQATDIHESQQVQMSVDEFCQWILSNIYRRQTAIRRVDLVKSTQTRHAFHESLLFHVEGPLRGGGKHKDTPLDDEEGRLFSSWRIIMERAGTIPQAVQVHCLSTSFSSSCLIFSGSESETFRKCPLQKQQNLALSILAQQRTVLSLCHAQWLPQILTRFRL